MLFSDLPVGSGEWLIGDVAQDSISSTTPGPYDTLNIRIGGHDVPLRSPLVPDGNLLVGGGGEFLNHYGGGPSDGYYNVAFGFHTLEQCTYGFDNTAVGHDALRRTTRGYSNSAFGYAALRENTAGYHNTAVGRWALTQNTSGINNTAVGHSALPVNLTGKGNVAVAHESLKSLVAGSYNIAIGVSAGRSLTTGDNNLLVGFQAGYGMTTGAGNILVGHNIDAPASTTCNFMSIANLIYGKGPFGIFATPSTGNVGIGIPAPQSRLHVAGDVRADGVFKVNGEQVVGAPAEGWSVPQGQFYRGPLDDDSPQQDINHAVMALVADLHAAGGHGLLKEAAA